MIERKRLWHLILSGLLLTWLAAPQTPAAQRTPSPDDVPESRFVAADQATPENEVDKPIAKVAAGLHHSALIHYDGSVFTWGDNAYGQLGLVQTDYADEPTLVPFSHRAVDISLGAHHTLILSENGHVYASGRNTFGQLGNQSTVDAPVPARIEGLSGIVSVSAGAFHSLALDEDGTVWAWGNNTQGQVGAVESQDILDLDEQVVGQRSLSPQPVAQDATAIAAGGSHSLFLDAKGQVFSWGDNSRGQLGNGTTQPHDQPALVAGLSGIVKIAAGYQHNLALGDGGKAHDLFAWGDDSYGQTGLGQHDARSSFRALPARLDWTRALDLEAPLAQVVAIEAGLSHSAAIVRSDAFLHEQGLLFWGNHEFGQLGQAGNASWHAEPKLLVDRRGGFTGSSFLAFDSIALGGYHTLLLNRQGLLAATGRGEHGQLGTATVIDRDAFSAVNIPDLFRPQFLPQSQLHAFWTDEGNLGLRFPKATDNLDPEVAYRVQIREAERSVTFDLERNQGIVLDHVGPEQFFEISVAALDSATENESQEELSRLVSYHLPEGQDLDAQRRQLGGLLETTHDPQPFAHRFDPALAASLHPLQVPWDVTPLQSGYDQGFPQPPNPRPLQVTAGLATLLTLVLALDRLRLRIAAQKKEASEQDASSPVPS